MSHSYTMGAHRVLRSVGEVSNFLVIEVANAFFHFSVDCEKV